MSRPSFTAIDHGLQSWDVPINDNFKLIDGSGGAGPVPLAQFNANGTDYANLAAFQTAWPAATFDRCFCFFKDGTVGWQLIFSDGAAWIIMGKIAAHQANSTAPDVATLVTDFNALLAKLQAAGLMA